MPMSIERAFKNRLSEFLQRDFDEVPNRYQLRVDMTGLQERIGAADDLEFQRRYGVSRNRINQYARDSWYDMSRRDMLTLLTLEKRINDAGDTGYRFLSVVADPIWETFGQPSVGFIGRDADGYRINIDTSILGKLGSSGLVIGDPNPDEHVADVMRVRNCIFVGSPKYNRWTEQAIEAMWPGEQAGVAFSWPELRKTRAESRIAKESAVPQLKYVDHTGRTVTIVDESPKRPVGVLVLCRSPLGTAHDVTTLIAAGVSKWGTLQIVEDLLAGHIYVSQSAVKRGRPTVLILMSKSRGNRWHGLDAARDIARKRKVRRAQRDR